MQSDAATVEDYLDSLPGERREPVGTVRDVVNAHLPAGYAEQMDWGMRLDIGRSCVRFERLEDLPLDVVGEVIGMIDPGDLIARYEAARAGR